MEKVKEVQAVLAILLSLVVTWIGGVDDIVILLLAIMLADVITGFTQAVYEKKVSSRELIRGGVRKGLIFLLIILAVRIDVIIELYAQHITIAGHQLTVRTIVLFYFILEELISVLENCANIGVPVPRWVRNILKQVSDTANNSTPKSVIDWIHKTFNIDLNIKKHNDKDTE